MTLISDSFNRKTEAITMFCREKGSLLISDEVLSEQFKYSGIRVRI